MDLHPFSARPFQNVHPLQQQQKDSPCVLPSEEEVAKEQYLPMRA